MCTRPVRPRSPTRTCCAVPRTALASRRVDRARCMSRRAVRAAVRSHPSIESTLDRARHDKEEPHAGVIAGGDVNVHNHVRKRRVRNDSEAIPPRGPGRDRPGGRRPGRRRGAPNGGAVARARGASPLGLGPAPMSRWLFDEGTGTTAADSAGTHPATLVGNAGWTPGIQGPSALSLDGAGDFADAGRDVHRHRAELHGQRLGAAGPRHRVPDPGQRRRQPGQRLLPSVPRRHAALRVREAARRRVGRGAGVPVGRLRSGRRPVVPAHRRLRRRPPARSRSTSTASSRRPRPRRPGGRPAAISSSGGAGSPATRSTTSTGPSTTSGSTRSRCTAGTGGSAGHQRQLALRRGHRHDRGRRLAQRLPRHARRRRDLDPGRRRAGARSSSTAPPALSTCRRRSSTRARVSRSRPGYAIDTADRLPYGGQRRRRPVSGFFLQRRDRRPARVHR